MGSYVENGLVTDYVNKEVSASRIERTRGEVEVHKGPNDAPKRETASSLRDESVLENSSLIPGRNEKNESDDDDEDTVARDGSEGDEEGEQGNNVNTIAKRSSNGENVMDNTKSDNDGDNFSKKKGQKSKGPCTTRCDEKKLRRMMNKIEHCTGEIHSEECRKTKYDTHKVIRCLTDIIRNTVKHTPNVTIRDFSIHVNFSECKNNKTSGCEPTTINTDH